MLCRGGTVEGLLGGIIKGQDLCLFVPSEVCGVVNLELNTELSISEEPGNPLISEGGLVRLSDQGTGNCSDQLMQKRISRVWPEGVQFEKEGMSFPVGKGRDKVSFG